MNAIAEAGKKLLSEGDKYELQIVHTGENTPILILCKIGHDNEEDTVNVLAELDMTPIYEQVFRVITA